MHTWLHSTGKTGLGSWCHLYEPKADRERLNYDHTGDVNALSKRWGASNILETLTNKIGLLAVQAALTSC